MRIMVVDNTKGLGFAAMTPRLLDILRAQNCEVLVVRDPESVWDFGRDVDGIILSGGPARLSERTYNVLRHSVNFTALLLHPSVPVLGICFGFQLMAAAYGARVEGLPLDRCKRGETISVRAEGSALVPDGSALVYAHHEDHVSSVPLPFRQTFRSADGTVQGMEWVAGKRYGVQFHPEGSPHGERLVSAFLDVCKIPS